MNKQSQNFDIAISGAGLVGASMAIALAKSGFKICLLERHDLNSSPPEDGRTSALSWRSKSILQQLDIWPHIENFAGEIRDILISDQDSPTTIHYDHNLVHAHPMGYVVENSVLHRAALNELKKHQNIFLISPTEITDVLQKNSCVKIISKNHDEFNANLLIIAEGKASSLRKKLNFTLREKNYQQTAITCNLKHSLEHASIAHENFRANGPLAILPMAEQNFSSLVWTETEIFAKRLMQISEAEFIDQLQMRIKNLLGEISLASPRVSYPLKLIYPTEIFSNAVILIGDAAHGMHPIAGQGLNVGLRDVEALTENLKKTRALGLQISSQTMIAQYAEERRGDVHSMLAFTDCINAVFRDSSSVVKASRRIGMNIVEHANMLKKFFIKQAMG
jgi:2-octaprenyl-6-methoxyphenol hydroxylase